VGHPAGVDSPAAAHAKLVDLGLVPHLRDDAIVQSIADEVHRDRDRVDPEVIRRAVTWRSGIDGQARAASRSSSESAAVAHEVAH
jgi:hypothetical protein